LLPTLSASSYGTNKGGAAGRVGRERASLDTLAKRGLLPTPTCSTSTYQRDRNGTKRLMLSGLAAAGLLPTPTSTLADHGGLITPAKAREGGTLIKALSARGAAGSLHPQFVEWMMGFPPGWTDLDDDDLLPTDTDSRLLATPSSRRLPESSAEP